MSRWPDFIIIGAMKAATSTLHEQLAQQPGISMSTPKEPCFFSDDEVWSRGVDWYQRLFEPASERDICGESSTHYTKLPTHPRTISRMKRCLPAHVKFIYILRHPIDRLISQYIHEWTQRVISCSINQAIDRHPELVAYSRYAMQIRPYLETFGSDRVLPVFFDHLSQHPQAELERVCQFIGYQERPRWNDDLKEQNVSSERLRKSVVRDALINLPGLRTVRRTLVPKATREWIKSFWTMKQRPTLSAQHVSRLTEWFDEDLQQLGAWLDLPDLACGTFKSIGSCTMPHWRNVIVDETASKKVVAA